ncbi:MAG: hypothetical protein ACYCXU_10100, partial [Thermoleophilia bacterium]
LGKRDKKRLAQCMDGLADDPYAEGSKKQRAIVNMGSRTFIQKLSTRMSILTIQTAPGHV